jgi:predicted ATPase
MCCCIYTAAALWMLGYPGQALARGREALTIARERAHPFSVAMALSETAIIHQYCGEVHRTHEHADAVMALSTEQQFAVRLAEGTMLQGWVRTVQGEVEEGIMQLSQGLAAFHATGIENVRPYYLALLAEAQGKAGRVEEGLSTLTTALTLVDQTGERFYAAELYRLQGELLLQRAVPDTQQAEACVYQALHIARQQQARSWELRAAMSLARLWQRQGKRGAARRLLAEVYHWFTEGFDTADLKTAKALLEELSG